MHCDNSNVLKLPIIGIVARGREIKAKHPGVSGEMRIEEKREVKTTRQNDIIITS